MSTIEHKKNTPRYVSWPMVSVASPDTFLPGLAGSITLIGYSNDGGVGWNPITFSPPLTIREIASTGVYETNLSAADMNHDRVMLKMFVAGAAHTSLMFDCRQELAEDLAGPLFDPVQDNLHEQHDLLKDTPRATMEFDETTIAAAPAIGARIRDNLNDTITSRSSHSAADVWTENIAGISGPGLAGTQLNAAAAGGGGATAQEVWEYAARTLTAATNITSDGQAINTTAGVVDTVETVNNLPATLTAQDVRNAMRLNATGPAPATGSIDYILESSGVTVATNGWRLLVPADPPGVPNMGTANILDWQAFFAGLSVGRMDVTDADIAIRNTSNDVMASGTLVDDTNTFTAGELF